MPANFWKQVESDEPYVPPSTRLNEARAQKKANAQAKKLAEALAQEQAERALYEAKFPPPKRNSKGQFLKGQSGHREGKPKAIVTVNGKELTTKELYAARAPRVMEEMWKLITDPTVPAATRLNAMKEWNDRALGKPEQSVNIASETKNESRIDVRKLDLDTRLAVLGAVKEAANDAAD